LKGAAYIDGFNLYHAIDDLKKPHLKWINLRRFAEIISEGHAKSIERVVFATAYMNKTEAKQDRHERFVRANEYYGVYPPMGSKAFEDVKCPDCGWKWQEPKEKQTDINLALEMWEDARRNVFDVAFLVTADNDQAATVKFIKARLPEKKIFVITPPGREHSKHLRNECHGKIKITESHLERALLDPSITLADGRLILRPTEYDLPPDWLPPDQRRTDKPKGKPPKKWGSSHGSR
jgi:uncharacterized LabA/DUF88 family protein